MFLILTWKSMRPEIKLLAHSVLTRVRIVSRHISITVHKVIRVSILTYLFPQPIIILTRQTTDASIILTNQRTAHWTCYII